MSDMLSFINTDQMFYYWQNNDICICSLWEEIILSHDMYNIFLETINILLLQFSAPLLLKKKNHIFSPDNLVYNSVHFISIEPNLWITNRPEEQS